MPSTLGVVRRVLAADFACGEECFAREGTFVVQTEERTGRRRFPPRDDRLSLALATMGSGAVISCGWDRLDWARRHLGHLERDELFAVSTLALISNLVNGDEQIVRGPHLFYVCSPESLRPARAPEGIILELVDQDDVPSLYVHQGFPHALSYRIIEDRPDVLASVASHEGRVVGIAAASADCDDMWQVGIDVLAEYRGRGIGQALVSQLTAAICARGKIPYYGAALSNLASRNVAIGVGYRPCWTEVYTFKRMRSNP